MEEWIKVIAPLIGIAGLWWKLTTSMATKADLNAMKSDMTDMKADLKEDIAEVKSGMADLKADFKTENAELRADIREIRQLLYKNVVDTGSKGDNKDADRN